MLICPHCEQPLTRDGQAYRCQAGHAFDIARQGYINLLPRPTKLPSDTREMLTARRRFLARGYYAPLATAISGAVSQWLQARGGAEAAPGGILDAGCGEGYFTRAVAQGLTTQPLSAQQGADALPAALATTDMQATDHTSRQRAVYGLDLSRDAVRLAASYAHQTAGGVTTGATMGASEPVWLVGNIRDRLPFADASMAVILNVFAPHNPLEFARLLAPGGLLLIIAPTPDHLEQARERLQLLNVQPEKRSHLLMQFADGFALESEQVLAYTVTLDAVAQRDLRAMAPHRRTNQAADLVLDDHADLLSARVADELVTQISFLSFVFERRRV